MTDFSVLVANITFVVVEIIFKEDVTTSSVAKITYIVFFKVAVITSSVINIFFVVTDIIFFVG